jgi:exonuclease SbcD
LVKVVHFADLHLEAAFAWMGARDVEAPRRRRQGLRDTLRRIVRLAADERADALLCGGDLYEHEHFTPDTVEFVRSTFADIEPLPVYIAPGNHDWLGPESLYRQANWTPNVHIFNQDRLQPITLQDGLTLWGGAHVVPANSDNFLERFRVDRGGIHLALFHGTNQDAFFQQGSGKIPHAPFKTEQIAAAGLAHAFIGHFHRPIDAQQFTYPGNPDPLSFGEEGSRGAVIATIAEDGSVTRERRCVASTQTLEASVDVGGCTNLDEIADRIRASVKDFQGVARITLRGTLEPTVDLRLADLHAAVPRLQSLSIRAGQIDVAYDLAKLAEDRTVRGQFVQDVLAAEMPEDERRAILITGLRALAGRADLKVG